MLYVIIKQNKSGESNKYYIDNEKDNLQTVF